MNAASDVIVVFTNAPDQDTAEKIARGLIDAGIAACVNVLAPCRSVYRWKGEVETAEEVPVLIKTTRAAYSAVEACVRAVHPYELPELIAVPVASGLPEYLAWVRAECAAGER